MTGLTPPAGVEASARPLSGCIVEWSVPAPGGSVVAFRLRHSRVDIVPGLGVFAAVDPTELRRFLWAQLRAGLRLAHALEVGAGPAPEPEPDPQTTVDDFVDDVIEVRT